MVLSGFREWMDGIWFAVTLGTDIETATIECIEITQFLQMHSSSLRGGKRGQKKEE